MTEIICIGATCVGASAGTLFWLWIVPLLFTLAVMNK